MSSGEFRAPSLQGGVEVRLARVLVNTHGRRQWHQHSLQCRFGPRRQCLANLSCSWASHGLDPELPPRGSRYRPRDGTRHRPESLPLVAYHSRFDAPPFLPPRRRWAMPTTHSASHPTIALPPPRNTPCPPLGWWAGSRSAGWDQGSVPSSKPRPKPVDGDGRVAVARVRSSVRIVPRTCSACRRYADLSRTPALA